MSDEFKLDESFIQRYKEREPPFGFGGLGHLVYLRTYSRLNDDGSNETWWQTARRVVEGTYQLQREHIRHTGKRWNEHQGQQSAQEMYDRMFNMKFLPPGRGLWAMGTKVTGERRLFAALNNCAFVSTEHLREDLERPFTFLMDASMLGVGVGFDTRGEGTIILKEPDSDRRKEMYPIPDTREGWVKSVGILLRSYFLGDPAVEFDYSQIRAKGELIKTFGGKASGPKPLIDLHQTIRKIMENRIGRPISTRDIVDVMNLIGKAVVAGNVRRTAEVAFGSPISSEFLDLKNYSVNPERKDWGWASNNSIFAELGMDYREVADRIRMNGEPGLIWLENMRRFGRMSDPINDKDKKAMGANPCIEQTLEPYEVCCLVETFPHRHQNSDEWLRTLKFAYLYGKTVTLGETSWPETNEVMMRNRRIGCSVSGVAQFIHERGINEMKRWLRKGYDEIQRWDEIYSNWLAIPRSIKTTSVKPSGTVSLLAGATPGVHYPHAEFYLRRVRIAKDSNLVKILEEAGYNIEDDKYDPSSLVVDFPVRESKGIRGKDKVPMWEQLHLASLMQQDWADNQVSITVTFDPEREGHQIARALDFFQYELKGVSFLPLRDNGYEQTPYEEISAEEYETRTRKLKPTNFSAISGEKAEAERFCDGESCQIKQKDNL